MRPHAFLTSRRKVVCASPGSNSQLLSHNNSRTRICSSSSQVRRPLRASLPATAGAQATLNGQRPVPRSAQWGRRSTVNRALARQCMNQDGCRVDAGRRYTWAPASARQAARGSASSSSSSSSSAWCTRLVDEAAAVTTSSRTSGRSAALLVFPNQIISCSVTRHHEASCDTAQSRQFMNISQPPLENARISNAKELQQTS